MTPTFRGQKVDKEAQQLKAHLRDRKGACTKGLNELLVQKVQTWEIP